MLSIYLQPDIKIYFILILRMSMESYALNSCFYFCLLQIYDALLLSDIKESAWLAYELYNHRASEQRLLTKQTLTITLSRIKELISAICCIVQISTVSDAISSNIVANQLI